MFVFRGYCLLFAHVEQENVFSPTPDMRASECGLCAIQLSKFEGLTIYTIHLDHVILLAYIGTHFEWAS